MLQSYQESAATPKETAMSKVKPKTYGFCIYQDTRFQSVDLKACVKGKKPKLSGHYLTGLYKKGLVFAFNSADAYTFDTKAAARYFIKIELDDVPWAHELKVVPQTKKPKKGKRVKRK